MAQVNDLQLIAKIAAIAAVNKEILDRIPLDFVTKPKYTIERKNKRGTRNTIFLRQKGVNSPADLLTLCQPFKIHPIEDFFNDKLDYSVRSFEDLKRLNIHMLPMAKKYELFGNTPKALEVLQKFKENYEVIQVALGKVEEFASQQIVYEISLEEKVKKFNQRLQRINKMKEKLEEDIKLLRKELRGNNTSENIPSVSMSEDDENNDDEDDDEEDAEDDDDTDGSDSYDEDNDDDEDDENSEDSDSEFSLE